MWAPCGSISLSYTFSLSFVAYAPFLSLSLSLSPPHSPSFAHLPFRHTSHIWRVMSRPDCFDMLYECKGRSRERTAQEDGEVDFSSAAIYVCINTRGDARARYEALPRSNLTHAHTPAISRPRLLYLLAFFNTSCPVSRGPARLPE